MKFAIILHPIVLK